MGGALCRDEIEWPGCCALNGDWTFGYEWYVRIKCAEMKQVFEGSAVCCFMLNCAVSKKWKLQRLHGPVLETKDWGNHYVTPHPGTGSPSALPRIFRTKVYYGTRYWDV